MASSSTQRVILGLSCGPAVDGIEAVAATVTGQGPAMQWDILGETARCLPEEYRHRISALAGASGRDQPPTAVLRIAAELDRDLAVAAAALASMLIEQESIPPGSIDAVAWPGLCVWFQHGERPARPGSEIVLGDPAVLAARLGRAVVSRFGRGDLAAGGLGGPMTAWADWLMLRHERLSRAAVHLGGYATVTLIPADGPAIDIAAIEACPATCLLDAIMQKHFGKGFDTDGATAAAGAVNAALLNELLGHPSFQHHPPARLRPSDFGPAWLWRVEEMALRHDTQLRDLMTTATEFIARRVADVIGEATERPHEVILTGGGALNIHLAGRIRTLLSPSSTYPAGKYNIPLRSKQALCYALLAGARLDETPIYCPGATGCDSPCQAGTITPPPPGPAGA
jgi:anhydro-N-acetylmuramic acid kinase